MVLSLTAVTLSLFSALVAPQLARASPCIAMDANFNLLVFGLDGKDWNAGTQDTWSSSSGATDITTSNRPSFDASNTTCYLSQFENAVYVMNGDSSDTSAVFIYDAGAKSWSKQAVTTGNFQPSNFVTILDHDTNVFYAVSNNELFFLDMGQLKSANSSALSWTDVEKVPFTATSPVMALAQNHVHFLDVPSDSAGEAQIFVIHFSFFQPTAQSYPQSDGSAGFPSQHGQTASFFQADNTVQQEFAYIPDDGSATYVINVENNSTAKLAGPTVKDPNARYFAGVTSLVQIDSTGAVSFLPYKEGDASTNAAATWSTVANIAAAAPPGQSSSAGASGTKSGSGGASKTGSATGGSATQSGSSGSGSGSGSSSGAVEGHRVVMGLVGGVVLGALAMVL